MYQFNFRPVFDNLDMLFYGAWLTVQLSFSAMVLGLIVSILGAVAKTSGGRVLRFIVDIYVEAIRNTPFLIQIFFIYFGLPAIGISMSPNTAALVALVINVGAYGTEIIRAGIESVPQGQVEAGRALALNKVQIFRYVILKPALRNIYPSLTSQFIYLMLTSSVVSIISANDLAAAGADLSARTFANFEIYLALTIIYFLLAFGFSTLFGALRRTFFNYPASR
ncbi:polar amino acid ABC transporter, inner membrane subunit (plasmid) [Ketogulonicigenium vulgare Y25]|uniref:Amino acid ABC transporter, permease protein, 3-TM region, His/Glu/Gln/Arg/opine family protein n=1 Tax=Ketogulonicigenium vulgare (strain WSH-001) TaxID=759362 RepID=F9YBM7_KETVW|nr:ABC transporter permease subunit [Ketogulonicigenium vulgare]ADO44346.1 polar amino acid ABC transporter, inner membrane subunit [Ketogulonicigenium vulgare Y25]AEM42779.1 Amino acid ABC transporter, permease protein, 3-TM region, His/Glu/Gln/Arg/opine family protein [Ketogulonicigenium vulgare WSH-001]ALJ82781.1 ABC transporter permease [Ketogulonicigenium vulgare]